MRRTWNSWTYYGPDAKPGPGKEENVRPGSWKQDEMKSKGAVVRAFGESHGDAPKRAMEMSDARNDRVVRVMQAMEAGSYRVSAHDLAEKLVRNMLGEYR